MVGSDSHGCRSRPNGAAALCETMAGSHQWHQWVDPRDWDPWASRVWGVSIIEYISSYHDKYEYIFA